MDIGSSWTGCALDPSNSETEWDGNRFSSLVMVSGPADAIWDFSNVPHGTIEQGWYPSPTLHLDQRRMHVCLPPSYQANATPRYPVLYLLHGAGGDDDAWMVMTGAGDTDLARAGTVALEADLKSKDFPASYRDSRAALLASLA
jgi:enterochelin esterase-like enzyme